MSFLAGRPLALSLTGSGHLLVYQLGACNVLLQKANIQHVSGCSGGAIVAALMWQLPYPDKIAEYANEFIKSRGDGFSTLRKTLDLPRVNDSIPKSCFPTLSICTTRCVDGNSHTFDFAPSSNENRPEEQFWKILEASCRIPLSFHQYDMISGSSSYYPESEGIEINNDYHVDGGIAAPAPPTPSELSEVVISPVAGPKNNDESRISPYNNSWMVPTIKIRNLKVVPTLQNARALRACAGMTSSAELQEWYNRGKVDAENFIESGKLNGDKKN